MSTFSKNVERWRGPVSAVAGDVPVDFLLAWIDHESSGRSTIPVSSIGERGAFQVYPAEAQQIGYSDAQFAALSTEGDPPTGGSLNADSGVRLAHYYMGKADNVLSQVGASWGRSGSYWTLVKLFHGAPVIAKDGMIAVSKKLGRAPKDWNEFAPLLTSMAQASDPLLSATVIRLAPKLVGNSTEIAQKAGLSLIGKAAFGAATAIVLGVLAFFGYRWWKGRQA
jgi:hypothetical protein